MKHLKKWFTLVELVVVATILAVLATVWFISYEEYITDTRDSKRLAQLSGLRDGLRLWITKGALPLPDDHVEIRNNDTPFLHQWYAGANVLETISYSEVTKDPFDDTYYTYLLSRNRKDFQILGFLEEYNQNVLSSLTPNTYAVDYSQRFPQVMWKKMWILLEQQTNTPLQEMQEYSASGYIDLQDSTTNEFDAYITDTYLISWKEEELIWIIPYTTCKKIFDSGLRVSQIYNINPTWLNPFEVYCNLDPDMDGGWWALVARSHTSGTTDSFWWLLSRGSIRDDNQAYSLWIQSTELNFSEILATSYTSWKTIERAAKIGVDRNYIKDTGSYATASLSPWCEEVYPLLTNWDSPCDQWSNNSLQRWWMLHYPSTWVNDSAGVTDTPVYTHYFFHRASTTDNNYNRYGLNTDGWNRESPAWGLWELFGEQGMIFVR